jgi:thioredoxin-related protein
MKFIFKISLIVIVMLSLIKCVAKDNGLPEWYDDSRDAVVDLNRAANIADGRKILVIAGGDWCSWCHRLDKFIHSNKEISQLLDKTFVVLKVNFSDENKNHEFFKHYPEIKGYPAFIILDVKKQFLASQNTGDLESGNSYSQEAMLAFINKWK